MKLVFSRGVVEGGVVYGAVDVRDIVTLAFRVPHISGQKYWLSVGGYGYLMQSVADFEGLNVDVRCCLVSSFDKISTLENVVALLSIMGFKDIAERCTEKGFRDGLGLSDWLYAVTDSIISWSPFFSENNYISSSSVLCSPEEVRVMTKILSKIIYNQERYRESYLTRIVEIAREKSK